MSAVKQKRKATTPKSPSKAGRAPVAFVDKVQSTFWPTASRKGRPSLYTEAIAAEICERLAHGQTLNQICRSEHMPSRPAVISWVLEDRDGFSDRYARARDMLLEYWADELLDVSDDASNDWMLRAGKGKDGEDASPAWIANGENVNRSRLRVDSRKWLLSKLKPSTYGDRLSTELSGPGGGPIEVADINKLDLARRVASLLHAGLTEPSDAN